MKDDAHRKIRKLRSLGDKLEIIGWSLWSLALFAGIYPILIFGRTADPSTQFLQDAKGSWLPRAYGYAHPFWFLVSAALMLIIGCCLLRASKWIEESTVKSAWRLWKAK